MVNSCCAGFTLPALFVVGMLVTAGSVSLSGCGGPAPPTNISAAPDLANGDGSSEESSGSVPSDEPKQATPIPDTVQEEIYEPVVYMADADAATNVVTVDDQLPDLQLVDMENNPKHLSELLGDGLTIVVFWNTKKIFAQEQFLRLQTETFADFSPQGVKVIAVNVGDDADTVRQSIEEAAASFPVLLDVDGKGFEQIADPDAPTNLLAGLQR